MKQIELDARPVRRGVAEHAGMCRQTAKSRTHPHDSSHRCHARSQGSRMMCDNLVDASTAAKTLPLIQAAASWLLMHPS